MTQNNNIPQGYKKTEIGIIPQDWEVKRIQEICKVDAKSLSAKTSPNYEFEYISLSDVDSDSFDISTSHQIFRTAPSRARRIVSKGDVVISTVRPNLRGFFLAKEDKKDLIVSTGFAVLTPTECDSQYLLSFFFSQIVSKQFYSLVVGSNYPAVNSSDVAKLKLAVPPIEEQRKIAEILCVWDEAIEKQSRLIEKLELRKRALIRRLLIGRTRLPGFNTPWQKVKLGEIGKTYNGLTGKSKEDFEDGNAKFIPYINVFFNEKVNIDKLGIVSVDESEKQNKVQYGDIFFTVSSETPDEVGMASVLLEYIDDTYLNSFCFGYRLNDFETLNPIFASYILRGYRFRNYMMVLAQGSTRFNISKNEVMKLRIELPSLSEQKAIAEVLTTADDEIATHRKKLDALRLQKRGLMQQLLTGKTRVKI